MSEASRADEVRAQLRSAFAARLEPAGWQVLVDGEQDQASAAFICLRGGEIAATARLWEAGRFPDKPPVLVAAVFVGVSYEPLRRLSPLLGRYGVAVLERPVWRGSLGREDDDGDDGVPSFEVGGAPDADRLADELAPLILKRAPAFARRHPSLESLLRESGGAERILDARHAALLAAAGRFDEARAALERLRPAPGRRADYRSERRIRRQLRRWIDSEGNPALIPASPPPSRSGRHQSKPLSKVLAENHQRRAALEEVRQTARGESRDATREMLERELLSRGVEQQSALWIETTLDHLWDSPVDRAQLGIRALKGLGRFGMGVAKAIREHEIPDLFPPDWLEPPDHALYEFRATEPLIAVALDPDAMPLIQRVHDELPKVAGSGYFTAWLERQSLATRPGLELVVYVGGRPVGRVPAEAAEAYRQVIEDAAFRDEQPCLRARLTRRNSPTGYLLEIAKPAHRGGQGRA